MDLLRQRARRLRNTATEAERHLWQHLRLKQLGACRFRRQVPVAGYIVDFLCIEHRLIVELDGGQHLEQSAYDQKRTLALEAMGHRVLRYWNHEVLLHTCSVLEDILRALELSQAESRDKVKVRSESRSESTPPQSSPALRAREEAESNSNSSNSNSNSNSNNNSNNNSNSNNNNNNSNNNNNNNNSSNSSNSNSNSNSNSSRFSSTPSQLPTRTATSRNEP